jgi:hypothetical protein
MANPLSDKGQTENYEPIVINPTTVDEYKDSSILKPNELLQADNVVMDDGIVETVKGTLKLNTDSGNTPVYGLHRSYGKDGTNKIIRIANGNLQTDDPTFGGTALLTGLANKITPFIDIQGRAYGVNQTDGITRVDPIKNIAVKTGIVGPYLRKKIGFFESDETWVTGQGVSVADSDHYRSDEWSGNSMGSRKLTCVFGVETISSSYKREALDLSVFDNLKSSSEEDVISFYCMHDNWANLNFITVLFIKFGTSSIKTINLWHDDIPVTTNEWHKFEFKKSAFTNSSTPLAWDDVDTVYVSAASRAGTVNVWFDSIYLKSAKPKAVEMKRVIAKCDTADGFAITSGEIEITNDIWYQDNSALKFISTAGAVTRTAIASVLGTTVDLSTWPNGIASDNTDEIVFYIYVDDDTKIDDSGADPLIILIGQSNTVYWSYTFPDNATLEIDGRSDQWVEVRVPKSSFSAVGGIADWTAITYLNLALKFTANSTAHIDSIHMEPYQATLQLSTFDNAESTKWAAVAVTDLGKFTNEGAVEGDWCLALWGSASAAGKEGTSTWQVDWTAGTGKNLSSFGGGVSSSESDYITFYLKAQQGLTKNYITSLELWFDAEDATTFSKAYKYLITKDMMTTEGKYINIKKSDFDEVGGPADWSTIGAAKFILTGKGAYNAPSILGGAVYIDDMKLVRKIGQSGRYYYKYAFMVKDVYSSCSEISEKVDAKGSFVSLSNISTSQDSRVTSRAIFRLGGAYTSTWMLVGKIEDNTTTEWIDDVADTELVYSMGEDVPKGYINNVSCANLNYDPQSDRAMYWGDSTYKNRIYYSHPGFYHVVDEWGYREMPDDVMYVQPWYGQNIVIFKHTKKKINGDIATGELVDLPVTTGACSYYAVKKATMSILACVGQENVYAFDGYKDIPIGDQVRNYIKSNEEHFDSVFVGWHKDTIYIAITNASDVRKVLRYYIPTKSWSIMPDWSANVFCNFDKQNDLNEFYYGDSVNKNVYQVEYDTDSYYFSFNRVAISSAFSTGWINDPKNEVSIHHIEFKAKGTPDSVLTIQGYKNYETSLVCSGSITFPSTYHWRTYRFGPKNVWKSLSGDSVRIKISHSTQYAFFKVKDIVIYLERLPKRIEFNEVTVT